MNNGKHANAPADITRANLLARNMLINVFGYGAPLLIAVFTIPILIKYLGTDRFGILTLAWVVISYLGLFDMGLGRALTKIIAEKIGTERTDEIPGLIWTGILLLLVIGTFVGVIFFLLTPVFVVSFLKIPELLENETISAFSILSLSIPVVIMSVGLRGVLEAHQRFDLVNFIRIPLGVYSFAAPLLVLPFSNSILYIIFILIAGKFIGCIVQFYLCFKVVDSLTEKILISRSSFSKLMRLGSWMTVSNIIAPLLFYSERFFITGIISLTAVTYYATPNEIVTKLLLISGALLGVLFPALSTSFYADPKRTRMLFNQGIKLIFIILFPMTLAIVTFSEEGLRLWLGDAFARESTTVLQWMAVGVLIQSLGHISFAMIQGAGRPDMTAKLHVVELIVYIPLIILFAQWYGITGVAWIWVTRISIDALILTYFSRRIINLKHHGLMTALAMGLISAIVFLIAGHLNGFSTKIVFYFLFLSIFLVYTWKFLLLQKEKTLVLQTVSSFHNK